MNNQEHPLRVANTLMWGWFRCLSLLGFLIAAPSSTWLKAQCSSCFSLGVRCRAAEVHAYQVPFGFPPNDIEGGPSDTNLYLIATTVEKVPDYSEVQTLVYDPNACAGWMLALSYPGPIDSTNLVNVEIATTYCSTYDELYSHMELYLGNYCDNQTITQDSVGAVYYESEPLPTQACDNQALYIAVANGGSAVFSGTFTVLHKGMSDNTIVESYDSCGTSNSVGTARMVPDMLRSGYAQSSTVYVKTNSGVGNWLPNDWNFTSTRTLSHPYSSDEFFQSVLDRLSTLSAPWGSNLVYDTTCADLSRSTMAYTAAPNPPSASRDALYNSYHSPIGNSISARKVEYQITCLLAEGEQMDVTWNVWFQPLVGNRQRVQTLSWHVVGNGEVQTSPIYALAPPASYGTTYIDTPEAGGGTCGTGSGEVTFASGTGSGPKCLIDLGLGTDGNSAGKIVLAGSPTNALLATPAGLSFLVGSGMIVSTTATGGITITAPEGRAYTTNVTVNGATNSYKIVCVNKTGGIPREWTIAGTSNLLTITDANGVSSTFAANPQTETATYSAGNGLIAASDQWNPSSHTKTHKVLNNGAVVAQRATTYFQTNNAYGIRDTFRLQEVVGEGAGARTNVWIYDLDTNSPSYGLVRTNLNADGSWAITEYDLLGRITNRLAPFKNSPITALASECRQTISDYTPLGAGDDGTLETNTPRTLIELVLGQTVSRSYAVITPSSRQDIRCLSPEASWTNADNLVTKTLYLSVSGANRTIQLNPDGTFDLRDVTTDTARLTMSATGQPDATGTNLLNGSRTYYSYNADGDLQAQTTLDVTNGVEGWVVAKQTTGYGNPNNVHWVSWSSNVLAGTFTTNQYGGCCNLLGIRDREDSVTSLIYDALNRQVGVARAGITNYSFPDASGNITNTFRVGTNGVGSITSQTFYDLAGNVTASLDALGHPTYFGEYYLGGYRVRATTNADGGTRLERYYLDGHLADVTGTAVNPISYDYGVANHGLYTTVTKLDTNYQVTAETTTTYNDMLGRPVMTVQGENAAISHSFYNSLGQLIKQVDPDGVTTLFGYNAKGECATNATSLSGTDTINPTTDRIACTVSDVVSNDLGVVQRRTSYVFDGATFQWQGTSEAAVSGLASRQSSPTSTNWSHTLFSGGGWRTESSTSADGVVSTSSFANDKVRYVEVTANQVGDYYNIDRTYLAYDYDAFGRLVSVTDLLTWAVTTNGYNNADWVFASSQSAPGVERQTTGYEFDAMGRPWRVTLPDNGVVTTQYELHGLLATNMGARTYPVRFTYDAQGRRKTLTTTGQAGNATTTWNYDTQLGTLSGKLYADTHGPSYTYTPAGRVRTRTWVRPITATYTTNRAGQLSTVAYTGSTNTADLAYYYDRQGRLTNVVQGSTSTILSYDTAGQRISEAYLGGTLDGLVVSNRYTGALRTTLSVRDASGTTWLSNSYSFACSDLTNVSIGSNYSASLIYWNFSRTPYLFHNVQFRTNGTEVFRAHPLYDNLKRVTNMSFLRVSGSATALLASNTYAYNLANQRTNILLADGSGWTYDYDMLGQVTSGIRKWSNGTSVAGQQFGYAFDTIGNRTLATRDGTNGTRSASYTPDILNQITSRDVPGFVNIVGTATNTAGVAVNGQLAQRQGSYYRAEVAVSNAAIARWLTVTNLALYTNTPGTNLTTLVTGGLSVAASPESFYYDADGNLTSDGHFSYTWDAENRLVGVEATAAAAAAGAPKQRLIFGYDWQSRRIQKQVYNWVSGNWQLFSDQRFLYDGWNLIAIYDGMSSSLQATFTWGPDLSGTMQGAGGVGGLLAVQLCTGTNAGTYFVYHDANGNVTMLVNPANNAVVAEYEYGPFGELLRATGPLAKNFNFLFSTKYYDWETELYYYGYRYYSASTGTWQSRDPIEEDGGLDLYGFVENAAISHFDARGLVLKGMCLDSYFKDLRLTAGADYQGNGFSYTALRDVNPGDSFAARVVIRMMKSSTAFVLAGDSSAENIDNLKSHIGTRARVVNYTRVFLPTWAETGHGQLPTGDASPGVGESWSQWFQRLNQETTLLRCAAATKMIMRAATEENLVSRPNDHVFIPGEWFYVGNDAWTLGQWPAGYEGENMICVDVVGSGDDMFWGFPYKKVKSLSDWKAFIRDQFPVDAGVTQKGQPVEHGSIKEYPGTGLVH